MSAFIDELPHYYMIAEFMTLPDGTPRSPLRVRIAGPDKWGTRYCRIEDPRWSDLGRAWDGMPSEWKIVHRAWWKVVQSDGQDVDTVACGPIVRWYREGER